MTDTNWIKDFKDAVITKKKGKSSPWVCPRCGEESTHESHLSKRDNKTKVCVTCKADEDLFEFGVNSKEVQKIIKGWGW